LKHWVEMKAKPGQTPLLRSTISEHDHVNGYLDDCGFYDYVGRSKDHSKTQFNQGEMVKIEKENDKSRIKSRRDQLRTLITKFSSLTSNELERFVDHVLVEVTNNVSEHGKGAHNTLGWWIIAQYHRTHGYISICIADNGIGFRNSLLSGSQYKYIREKFSSIIDDEGKAIKLAFEESVSGALFAPVKEKKILGDRYERGSRRGNGIKIIREACKDIGIPLAVLSHHGYLFIDAMGAYEKFGHYDKRIFAGTLYHFLIPAKGVQHDKED
jgi:anti-sigma regulatory factor (Ser/Thr protein kinase)